LDLSKIESGVGLARTPCRLESIVSDAIQSASFQAELRKISLTAVVAPALRPVLGDPARLRQVVENLLSNALKYTLAGGSVTVRAWQDGNRTAVAIQDTGIGIPREALPYLFGKFYRVPGPQMSTVPGTGLGLAIVKTIMEQHEGQVWVESELGKGSTFAFSVPACEES
jgi:two-component system phosphate regulon sensor histidine kinase PhoR